jgi:hypothetical protein
MHVSRENFVIGPHIFEMTSLHLITLSRFFRAGVPPHNQIDAKVNRDAGRL